MIDYLFMIWNPQLNRPTSITTASTSIANIDSQPHHGEHRYDEYRSIKLITQSCNYLMIVFMWHHHTRLLNRPTSSANIDSQPHHGEHHMMNMDINIDTWIHQHIKIISITRLPANASRCGIIILDLRFMIENPQHQQLTQPTPSANFIGQHHMMNTDLSNS